VSKQVEDAQAVSTFHFPSIHHCHLPQDLQALSYPFAQVVVEAAPTSFLPIQVVVVRVASSSSFFFDIGSSNTQE
jgi:hypothetical protein